MKELTTEQKAKRYDEALKRTQKWYDANTNEGYRGIFKDIFPELRESEDEKIRKAIIEFFELQDDNTTYSLVPKKDILDWLEKQGEQKSADKVEPKFKVDEWITNGDYTWKIVEVKPLDYILQSQDGNIVDDTISHVDEQFHSFTIEDAKTGDVLALERDKRPFIFKGFDKFHPECLVAYCGIGDIGLFKVTSSDGWWTDEKVKPATQEQCDFLFKKMKENGYKWDAEKKLVDKIEPKFKVGDWCIDNEDGVIFQIVKVLDNTYTYKTNEGKEYSCTHYSLENDAHLWTIQDAKTGDVLVCKGNIKYSNGVKYKRICLFNNLDKAFFTLTKTSNYVEEYDIDVNIDYPDNTVPATKEQREILFMAMANASYELDAEKKELKKIEQKFAEWSEEDC